MSVPRSKQTDRGDAERATGIDSGYAAPGVAASVGAGCDELSESDCAPECGRTSCPPETAPGADTACWWAMSAVYNRSMKAKAALDDAGVRCFVPMRWEERTAGRRKVRRRVPAVHNLIFVRTDAAGIRALKESLPYLQYLMRREGGMCDARGGARRADAPLHRGGGQRRRTDDVRAGGMRRVALRRSGPHLRRRLRRCGGPPDEGARNAQQTCRGGDRRRGRRGYGGARSRADRTDRIGARSKRRRRGFGRTRGGCRNANERDCRDLRVANE